MRERIISFLTHYGLTATKYADTIGVQRSSVSHIISGRNKPSFDFIEKTLLKYPEVNPDWLILGKGNMIRDISGISSNIKKSGDTLFDLPSKNSKEKATGKTSNQQQNISKDEQERNKFTNVNKYLFEGGVVKIVLFYNDKTFEEYTARK